MFRKVPELKTDTEIKWKKENVGADFEELCELLRINAIPTKRLDLEGDKKIIKESKIER